MLEQGSDQQASRSHTVLTDVDEQRLPSECICISCVN